ncbi:MAG: glucose-6-phosphate isomerase [Anaerovoracaceae bacterium]|jgi:glucose-6-phosphate isomerase
MEIKVELGNSGIDAKALENRRADALSYLDRLWAGEYHFTGWVNDPHEFTDDMIRGVQEAADGIREKCDVFLVLGVGGSFMGAKAVIDMLAPDDADTEVLFAGYNFSGRYINEIKKKLDGRDFGICVISKSGTTTETLSAYGIFKEMLVEKYGAEGAAGRTYVVTENRSNYLFDEATAEGCTIFDLAVDIGGRYSVLTPVGLLPIAVAGIDIQAMMEGARKTASKEAFGGSALDYACARDILYKEGKRIEVFEFFDPYFAYFGEWLKQLFGESEGKDGKGLFPASLMFSRDLHSMGQFLQQGTPCFFETFITVDEAPEDAKIPEDAMKPFAGKTIEQINVCAQKGVLNAHVAAGTPVVSISMPKLDAYHVGMILYFFETECAVSALLSGVDPFNQPGVEAYKKEMRAFIEELDD